MPEDSKLSGCSHRRPMWISARVVIGTVLQYEGRLDCIMPEDSNLSGYSHRRPDLHQSRSVPGFDIGTISSTWFQQPLDIIALILYHITIIQKVKDWYENIKNYKVVTGEYQRDGCNMWCDLGKSVGSCSGGIFSFLFDWCTHLDRYILLETPHESDQWFTS